MNEEPKLLFDDIEDNGTDLPWSRTPDDVIDALQSVGLSEDDFPTEGETVDPLLWIKPEAQEKWEPFVSDDVKAFWQQRAEQDNEEGANESRMIEANFSQPLKPLVEERHGLKIIIENAKGSTRTGYHNGVLWSVKMPADYGYIASMANSWYGDREGHRLAAVKGKIGPHEGMEFGLMAKGKKPAAILTDDSGEKERQAKKMGYYTSRHKNDRGVLFVGTTKQNLERLKSAHGIDSDETGYDYRDRKLGEALGYSKKDIDYFIEKKDEGGGKFSNETPIQNGADNDGMDCWVGDSPNNMVYIVSQKDLDTGKFDEHKCFVDFKDKQDATDTYCQAYDDGKGKDRIMSVATMPMNLFKEWLLREKPKSQVANENFFGRQRKDDLVRNKAANIYLKTLESSFHKLESEVLHNLLKHHSASTSANAAIDPIFNLDEFASEFLADMFGASQEAFEICAQGSLDMLGEDQEATDQGVTTRFALDRQNLIKDIPNSIFNEIEDTLTEGVNEGETADELAERVREEFSDLTKKRAKLIAMTETQAAYGKAQYVYMKRAGHTHKQWITCEDELVRPSHVACGHEGAIPIDELFTNGLMYPGDSNGGAGEVINCRCYLAVPDLK